jgi:hypothetical protein
MRRFAILTTCLVALFLIAGDDKRKTTYVNLQPYTNQKLKESRGNEGNNLVDLKQGEQTLEGVKFKIGEGLIQLSSTNLPDKPKKVEDIEVGATFSKLHILHATHWAAEKDAIIGYFTVNYEDNGTLTIPIVYGKDTLDWWYQEDDKGPSRAKVAWKGINDDAKNSDRKIRLYATIWKNPEPARKVKSIDFGSTNYTEAAPFCVAITAEE